MDEKKESRIEKIMGFVEEHSSAIWTIGFATVAFTTAIAIPIYFMKSLDIEEKTKVYAIRKIVESRKPISIL